MAEETKKENNKSNDFSEKKNPDSVEGFVASELAKDKQRPNPINLPDDPKELEKIKDWPQGRPVPKPLKTDKLQIIVDEPQFPLNYQTRRNVQIVEYLCSLPSDKERMEWLHRKVFKDETVQRFMSGVQAELEYRKRINNGHDEK